MVLFRFAPGLFSSRGVYTPTFIRSGSPSDVARLIKASRENSESVPSSNSSIRGHVTPQRRAASSRFHFCLRTNETISSMSSARRRRLAASSGVSARASQTLSKYVDSVIVFTSHQIGKTCSCQLDIVFGSLLRFLLEYMKNIDRFWKTSRKEQPECARCVSNADLFNALPDGRHGLAVYGGKSPLYAIKLVSGVLFGGCGEIA